MAQQSEQPCPRLLVGVSGSLSAVHLPQYLMQFRQEFAAEIQVVMTAAASRLVSPQAIAAHADGDVHTELWHTDRAHTGRQHVGREHSPHLRLASWARLFVVLPASANTIAKAAHGLADDLLSATILASPRPVVFAPAMNARMLDHPAVQRNLATLSADGHHVIPPRAVAAISTGEDDGGRGPTLASVLPHLRQVLRRTHLSTARAAS